MAYRKPYYDEDHRLHVYTFSDFLTDAVLFFKKFFTPRNIRHAFRSVIGGVGEYSVFLISLLLVQCFFWCIWMDCDMYCEKAREISRDCDYNLLLEGYTDTQWASIVNKHFNITDNEDENLRGYISYETSKYYGKPGEVLIRLKVLLTEDSEEACADFIDEYELGGSNIQISYGERTLYLERIEEKTASAHTASFFACLLAVVILLSLFIIRLNHFKFRYGIYMAFGADFEKLTENCAWEMTAAAVLTYIPALLLSCLVFGSVAGGLAWSAIPGHMLHCLIWILCAVFMSVLPAIRIIASSTPQSMMLARDNGNYVSSPRRSFRIFGRSFPFHYELFSFIRFRSYYIILLAFAVAFTTLYSCGLFTADLKATDEQSDKAQFVISSTTSVPDDDTIDEIEDREGIDYLYWSDTTSATSISAHVLLDREQAGGILSRTVNNGKGSYADNNFRYFCLSDRLMQEIEDNELWDVEGDLSALSGSTSCVAVSLSLANQKMLNINVGDTITLAAVTEIDSSVDFSQHDKKLILRQLLDGAFFSYTEVTVAAIIDDGYTGDEYTVAVSPALYEKLTGKEESRSSVSVYLKDGTSAERCEKIRNEITGIISSFDGMSVYDTGRIYTEAYSGGGRSSALLRAGSMCLLLICPLVWFYSQLMFERKRRTEMYMIGAMGGTDRDLSKLFLFSGGALALLACLATALFSSVFTYIIYWIVNVLMPSLGFGDSTVYTYRISAGGFLMCLAISVASAIISTWLPFRLFLLDRDRRRKAENGELRHAKKEGKI